MWKCLQGQHVERKYLVEGLKVKKIVKIVTNGLQFKIYSGADDDKVTV